LPVAHLDRTVEADPVAGRVEDADLGAGRVKGDDGNDLQRQTNDGRADHEDRIGNPGPDKSAVCSSSPATPEPYVTGSPALLLDVWVW
jgi:hypothetical protein